MRIFAAHLLNDYSGSPKVLRQLIQGWIKLGVDCTLLTTDGREGFLSNISGLRYRLFKYKCADNKWLRLLFFLMSQIQTLFILLKCAKRTDIIYVNTIYPWGAALAGKLLGCTVIYHIHETSIRPRLLKAFLFGIARRCSSFVFYVSHYLAKHEAIPGKPSEVLYNALESEFIANAKRTRVAKHSLNNVLMVCSLKEYKGVREFVKLALALPFLRFKLVLNASQTDIQTFFNDNLPANLEVFPTQKHVESFYQWSDVVLNLSDPKRWLETFGLTILEGMAFGNPAIVPASGGITEVVNNHRNGYHLSIEKLDEIVNRLLHLHRDKALYRSLSENALAALHRFSETHFLTQNIQTINRLHYGKLGVSIP